ncbi:MAG: hypothetical protein ACI8W8_004388 [Rhodothermales bacterium]
MVNAHGEQTIEFAPGTWTGGQITFEKALKTAVATTNGKQSIAASGGWQSDDRLRLWVYMNETPFRLQFDFTFKANSVTLDLSYNVAFDKRDWQFTGAY